MFRRVHVSGGLAYMSWDVNVQKSTCIWWPGLHVMLKDVNVIVKKSTCIWWPGLHVMGCECSEEYMYLVVAYMSWDVNVQ